MKEYKYSIDSPYHERDGFTTEVNALIREVCADLGFSELGICVESIRRRLSEEPDMLEIALDTRIGEDEDEEIYLLRHPNSHASEYWGLIPEFTVESMIQDLFLAVTGDHAADEYLRRTIPKPTQNELLSQIKQIYTREIDVSAQLMPYKDDAFLHTVRMTDEQVFTFLDTLSDDDDGLARSVVPANYNSTDTFISSAAYRHDILVWSCTDNCTKKSFDRALRSAEATAFLVICLYHGHSYNCPTAKPVSKSHYNTAASVLY